MKQSLVSTLSLAALLGFGSAAHGAITFSYASNQLTVNVSENVDFTLTADVNLGDDVWVVFPDAYSSASSNITDPGVSGLVDLELTPNASGSWNRFIEGQSGGILDGDELILSFGYGLVLSLSSGSKMTLTGTSATSSTNSISQPSITEPTVAFLAKSDGTRISDNVAVPEPGAAAAVLGLAGLSAVAGMRWRRRRGRG